MLPMTPAFRVRWDNRRPGDELTTKNTHIRACHPSTKGKQSYTRPSVAGLITIGREGVEGFMGGSGRREEALWGPVKQGKVAGQKRGTRFV